MITYFVVARVETILFISFGFWTSDSGLSMTFLWMLPFGSIVILISLFSMSSPPTFNNSIEFRPADFRPSLKTFLTLSLDQYIPQPYQKSLTSLNPSGFMEEILYVLFISRIVLKASSLPKRIILRTPYI